MKADLFEKGGVRSAKSGCPFIPPVEDGGEYPIKKSSAAPRAVSWEESFVRTTLSSSAEMG